MHLPRHPAAVAASLLAVGALGTGVAFAATAGDSDPDFNGGAPALIAFPGSPDTSVQELTVAPDGSVFTAAGSAGETPELLLAHLDASGAPVAGFGGDGTVVDDTIAGLASGPEALAVADDGDLLVGLQTNGTEVFPTRAGKVEGGWGTGDSTVHGDFTVERYDASGARVGESRVDVDPDNDLNYGEATIAAIVPRPDGTTLLLGSALIGEHLRFVRVLLGADGRPVTSFGDDGVAVDTGVDVDAYAAGVQGGGPEGRAVIAGIGGDDLVLRRYLADGSVDPSYGGTFPHEVIGSTATKTAALAPDGSMYFSITYGEELWHFTASGQPDTSFGTGGKVDASLAGVYVERMAVQPDGKVLLAGHDAGNHQTVIARLNADGTLDTSYGDGGTRTLPLTDGLTYMGPDAIAVQPDGKAVVGGNGFDAGETPPARARVEGVEPGQSVGFVARLGGDPKSVTTTTGTTTAATTTDTTTTTTTTTTTDTTTTPTQTTTTTATTLTTATTPAPAAQPVTAASTNPLPVARSCVSRRSFKIHLRIPRGAVATSAAVKVNDKQVKVVKGSRLRAAIDLRGLPKGKATVSIVVKLAHGKKPLTGSRVYHTCTPKRGSSVPAL